MKVCYSDVSAIQMLAIQMPAVKLKLCLEFLFQSEAQHLCRRLQGRIRRDGQQEGHAPLQTLFSKLAHFILQNKIFANLCCGPSEKHDLVFY